MNTMDLIVDRIVYEFGDSKAQARRKAELVFATIVFLLQTPLGRAEGVRTPLGRFSLVEHAEQPGRNPRTGAAITIPARRKIRFKPALALKRRVNPEVRVPR